MIKVRVGGLVILGLSRANVERLMKGDSIIFAGEPLGLDGVEVAIHFGETESAIHADLENMLGQELPPLTDPGAKGH